MTNGAHLELQQHQQQQQQQKAINNTSSGKHLSRQLKRLFGQKRCGGGGNKQQKKQKQQIGIAPADQPRMAMQPQIYVVGSPNPKSPFLRIAHVSDTCEATDEGDAAIYEADVLVHTGNLCSYQFSKHFFKDSEFQSQIKAINCFFARMPHRYKIFVAGPNESFDAESREKIQALLPTCTYLQDSSCVIEGVRFHGTPWTVSRRGIDGRGFVKSSAELKTIWSNIPDGVDVFASPSIPCNSLYEELVARIRPKLFLYGCKQERSSKLDQHEENCVKFKDNIIFANGHVANTNKRGIFDYYADAHSSRDTRLPKVTPQAALEAAKSATPLARRRHSLLSCIQS